MMTFYRRDNPDGSMAGIHMNGSDFDAECDFSVELVNQSIPEFLSVSGDMLTITVDEGTATYKIIDRRTNGIEPMLVTRLVGVKRPETVGA